MVIGLPPPGYVVDEDRAQADVRKLFSRYYRATAASKPERHRLPVARLWDGFNRRLPTLRGNANQD